MSDSLVISAIDTAPLNRGLRGAEWLATPGNIPIVIGRNVTLFDDEGDGAYQVHFLFAERGRSAIDAAREAFRRMFEEHGAKLIIGLVPVFRRDVALLARWIGGKRTQRRYTPNGYCDVYVMSREMWENDK